ncbi:MAG: hypothetical protein N2643_00565 [Endomicrobia bacterium]|nr:hypothetical protein [Endomicrobiia bacterium]
MRKLLIICLIFMGISVYYVYRRYYLSGEINNYLSKYSGSTYAQNFEYFLGVIFDMIGKKNSAIFRFERVISVYYVDNKKPDAYYNIAKIYEEEKEMKKALKYYRLTFENYASTYEGELAKKRYDYLLLLGYREN